MTTTARPTNSQASHWYTTDGKPFYEVPYADPKKPGTRKATIADARKVGAIPSVTTVLKILDKPGLNNWRIEQAVLAVLTSPKKDGESEDDFVKRILHTEEQQEQEGQKARDIGVEIHDAIEAALNNQPVPANVTRFVDPVLDLLNKEIPGRLFEWTEVILVGKGYAGRADLVTDTKDSLWIVDFKTTKKLPTKEPWQEHKLQLSAYAATQVPKASEKLVTIRTANLYISSLEPGKLAWFEVKDWAAVLSQGFIPLLDVWQWMNNYRP